MGIEVSIIIPNWNGGDVLTECLMSILVHTRSPFFELIIVDNGSTDSSLQIIRQLAESDDRVKPIFNRENLFFARACNQGFDISTGRYVIVGKNDIVLQTVPQTPSKRSRSTIPATRQQFGRARGDDNTRNY